MANTQGIPLPSTLGEAVGETLLSTFHSFAQIINNIFGHFGLRFKVELPILGIRNNINLIVIRAKTSTLVAQRVQHNKIEVLAFQFL